MSPVATPVNSPTLPGYTFVETIYQGNRTTVYRALETDTQQPVAIKTLAQAYPSFAELVQFRNQYTVTKNLPIPGIVRPLHLEPYGNGYALIMEAFEGVALGQYCQQHTLSLTEILGIALQLTDILHDLCKHRILHKDIKPANILIYPETKQVKLIDFSIASLLPREHQALQSPGALEGTLAYLAPEQTGRMNRGIDYRADYYALGITLYELLTGQLPFPSENPMALLHCHLAKTPVMPHAMHAHIPEPVSAIVMKLMAKNAEERYQSALGLKHDLQRCLSQWEETRQITGFELGMQDVSDRFLIPEKLYGREAAVKTLLNAFERVSQGTSELMLVAGYSGVGKTAVVNEVHKPIVAKRGYFVKGKYDQFNRNIPFSAFVQAFRDLMEQLLGESEAQLQGWKSKILETVGDNGQVLIDVIPELEAILGSQPPVPDLSGSAAQNRFNFLFEKFIAVFTTQDHPLVMFLDDLQWADSASLNLLQVLMGETQTGYLLLLGAYRDNEVFPAHPLMLSLGDLEKQKTTISTITLAPLSAGHINQLVAETLSCTLAVATPLTDLVYQKTKGNPFFTTQFLKGLHADGWITCDRNVGYWECDLVQVQAAALTDDVVDFMAGRLHKLPIATQNVLKLAACIGNQFDLETLAIICETPSVEVADDLWSALQSGLILPQSEAYKFFHGMEDQAPNQSISVNYHFLHDQVQQAAYALIDEERKQITHLNIGRLLLQKTSAEAREKKLFKIVNQLNIGISLIDQPREIEDLAQLNLVAAQKAKSAAAYHASEIYLAIAIELLHSKVIFAESWHTHYELMLPLHDLLAEVSYLNGEYEAAQQQTQTVIDNAQTLLDKIKAYEIRISLLVAQSDCQRSLDVGLEILSLLDVSLDDAPLSDIDLERLYRLPAITNPKIIAALNILSKLWAPALIAGSELLPKVILTMLNLSATHGNSAIGAFAYSLYGMLLCAKRTDIELGYSFGKLALHTLERYEDAELTCKVKQLFHAFIRNWTESARDRVECLADNVLTGLDTGDIEFACYSSINYCDNLFLMGECLDTVRQKQTYYIELAKNLQQSIQHGDLSGWGQMVDNLMGMAVEPTQLVGRRFDESIQISKLQANGAGSSLFFIYTAKTILNYLFDDYEQALIHSQSAINYEQAGEGMLPITQISLYRTLGLLALYHSADRERQAQSLDEVETHQQRLRIWANHAPMNHQHKVDLVEAEKCRVLGQKLEALELYDKAIAGAKENEYLQEEALANELAAKFYLDLEKEKVAAGYMQEAYYCYSRWGAKAKVDQLVSRYAQLLEPILQSQNQPLNLLETLISYGVTSYSHVSHAETHGVSEALDFASVIQSAQLLSSNLSLENLIAQLMKLMRQSSGAETCALILPETFQVQPVQDLDLQGEWLVHQLPLDDASSEAETMALEYSPKRSMSQPLSICQQVPSALIRYVRRTGKAVQVDGLAHEDRTFIDEYLLEQRPQSVLVQPIHHQDAVVGVLYLENKTTANVFNPSRRTVIDFFCNQAGIALENARLYQQQAYQAQALTIKNQALQVAKQTAEAASRAKSHFLQNVSHELRTPLTGILGYSQILKRSSTLSEKERQGVETIHECGNNLLKLVDDVIAITQTETVPLKLTGKTVNLPVMLRNVVKTVEPKILRCQVQLGCQLSSQLPEWVWVDGSRLRQVLLSLLENAVKFTEQGDIRLQVDVVTMSDTQASLKFQVVDTGIGISAADQVNLFRLFEQVRNTHTQAGGLGMGLAMSQLIVQEMGSALTVESQLGQGSQFSFVVSLPLCQSPLPAQTFEVDGLRAREPAALRAREPAAPTGDMSDDVEETPAEMLIPPQAELQELLKLSKTGRLRKIRQQLEQLQEKDSRYASFVQPILALEKQFKVDEIEVLLLQYLSPVVELS